MCVCHMFMKVLMTYLLTYGQLQVGPQSPRQTTSAAIASSSLLSPAAHAGLAPYLITIVIAGTIRFPRSSVFVIRTPTRDCTTLMNILAISYSNCSSVH